MKTPKGTDLPMTKMKGGKDYLMVAYRLVWFREEHPEWSIVTEPVSLEKDRSVFRAMIRNTEGHLIASAHKQEDVQGFPDHMEKAETGAIGRALALCGYGTQFAPELDEGERLADSPLEARKAATTSSDGPPPHTDADFVPGPEDDIKEPDMSYAASRENSPLCPVCGKKGFISKFNENEFCCTCKKPATKWPRFIK